MKTKGLILFLFFCYSAFGQCDDYDKLDLGGNYMSRTRHYLHFYPEITDTVKYCCDLNKISKYANPILEKAKSFIVSRGGESFYSKLKLHAIEVNYPESVKYNYEDKQSYILEKYNITYWILYTYNEDQYAFGLLFDKDGNFISENMFPDIRISPGFENFIEPCDALSIAKNHGDFGDKNIEFIELTYVNEINSFCWLIKEEYVPKEIGPFHEDLTLVYINAITSEIFKFDKEEIVGVACGSPKIKFVKQ